MSIQGNNTASRFLAVALLLAPLLLLVSLLLNSYIDYLSDQYDHASLMHKKNQRLEYLDTNRDRITQLYRSYRTNRSVRSVFVTVNSDIDPVKYLASEIARLNTSTCKLLESTSKQVEWKEKNEIRLNYEAECNLHDLYNLVVQLDNMSPVVLIESMTLKSLDSKYDTRIKASLKVKSYVL